MVRASAILKPSAENLRALKGLEFAKITWGVGRVFGFSGHPQKQ